MRTILPARTRCHAGPIAEEMFDMPAIDRETAAREPYGELIRTLAQETGLQPEYIRELYERELAQLGANARLTGFLSVLAGRNVRLALRDAH